MRNVTIHIIMYIAKNINNYPYSIFLKTSKYFNVKNSYILPYLLLVIILKCNIYVNCDQLNDDIALSKNHLKPDPKGYILFCLCMGRFGNQVDHLLGGMAFAKMLDRTLILPPFRTYRNVHFDEYFKVDIIKKYTKVILADEFMEMVAPKIWPLEKRYAFCYLPLKEASKGCRMKEGNPFGPFWDGLKVDFVKDIVYQLNYDAESKNGWIKSFPFSKYPVLAMRGAPAAFPVLKQHRNLQKYLVFSDKIQKECSDYINTNFLNEKYMGLHLRNNVDWEQACNSLEKQNVTSFMASPQCIDSSNNEFYISKKMCFPTDDVILNLVTSIVRQNKIKVIFVATDRRSMKAELTSQLNAYNVTVFHWDPWNPLYDLAVLIKSDIFIGNCISSFTAFVSRARKVQGDKPTLFWSK